MNLCKQCGNILEDHERVCPNCGQAAPSVIYTLTLVRPDQFYLVNPPMDVLIDDTSYKLQNASSISVPLKRGYHQLSISCSFRKKSMEFILVNNRTMTVKWNRMTGAIEIA